MSSKKRKPPLALDMDFSEALGRFCQTDLKEVRKNDEKYKSEKKNQKAT